VTFDYQAMASLDPRVAGHDGSFLTPLPLGIPALTDALGATRVNGVPAIGVSDERGARVIVVRALEYIDSLLTLASTLSPASHCDLDGNATMRDDDADIDADAIDVDALMADVLSVAPAPVSAVEMWGPEPADLQSQPTLLPLYDGDDAMMVALSSAVDAASGDNLNVTATTVVPSVASLAQPLRAASVGVGVAVGARVPDVRVDAASGAAAGDAAEAERALDATLHTVLWTDFNASGRKFTAAAAGGADDKRARLRQGRAWERPQTSGPRRASTAALGRGVDTHWQQQGGAGAGSSDSDGGGGAVSDCDRRRKVSKSLPPAVQMAAASRSGGGSGGSGGGGGGGGGGAFNAAASWHSLQPLRAPPLMVAAAAALARSVADGSGVRGRDTTTAGVDATVSDDDMPPLVADVVAHHPPVALATGAAAALSHGHASILPAREALTPLADAVGSDGDDASVQSVTEGDLQRLYDRDDGGDALHAHVDGGQWATPRAAAVTPPLAHRGADAHPRDAEPGYDTVVTDSGSAEL
jgi:hypothetical protein